MSETEKESETEIEGKGESKLGSSDKGERESVGSINICLFLLAATSVCIVVEQIK